MDKPPPVSRLQRPSRPRLAVGMGEGAAEARSHLSHGRRPMRRIRRFIFNHNEVILYEWVEEYEPELFERISNSSAKANGTSWVGGIFSPTATCRPANLLCGRFCWGGSISGEVRCQADNGDQLRSLRPHPGPRADPRQERLQLLYPL